MGNQTSVKPVSAADLKAFVALFRDLKNVVWSTCVPIHGGVSHVVLLGEDHYLEEPVGSSRTFLDVLRNLRVNCKLPVDVFIEESVRGRPWVATVDAPDEASAPSPPLTEEPVLHGVRREMELKRDCAHVRLHVTDARDQGVMELLGPLRADAPLDPEHGKMSFGTLARLTDITLLSIDHQVELITKMLRVSELTPIQRAVADRALGILDARRSSPPLKPYDREAGEDVRRRWMQERADVSMDQLTWLSDITTAVRLLAPGRAPLVVAFGGYEHMQNIAQMLDPAFARTT